ncbi:MAG TPA: dephospho-CoA kinase [Aequorivita sp.]|nr:dephospho-CoA kinase [Aequorivita sp.]
MKIVGITGGIGSGKTTVAKMFASLGAPIYNADVEAKILTNTSPIIRESLIKLLGNEVYKDGELNRKYMADKIFNDKVLLQKANAIIHPQVAKHFKNWVKNQDFPYVLKEAAILFESGSYKQCDQVILVTAPKETRILRVMERDNATREEVEARMKNQWEDSEKMKLADFILQNEQISETQKQVEAIHHQLI